MEWESRFRLLLVVVRLLGSHHLLLLNVLGGRRCIVRGSLDSRLSGDVRDSVSLLQHLHERPLAQSLVHLGLDDRVDQDPEHATSGHGERSEVERSPDLIVVSRDQTKRLLDVVKRHVQVLGDLGSLELDHGEVSDVVANPVSANLDLVLQRELLLGLGGATVKVLALVAPCGEGGLLSERARRTRDVCGASLRILHDARTVANGVGTGLAEDEVLLLESGELLLDDGLAQLGEHGQLSNARLLVTSDRLEEHVGGQSVEVLLRKRSGGDGGDGRGSEESGGRHGE